MVCGWFRVLQLTFTEHLWTTASKVKVKNENKCNSNIYFLMRGNESFV